MKTIVHIGQHKTATTSIQRVLTEQREWLISQGVWFPLPMTDPDQPSHYPLNVYCLESGRMSPKKAKLLTHDPAEFLAIQRGLKDHIRDNYQQAKAQGCDRVIWSNEGLYLLNSVPEYQRLHDLFTAHSEQVTCVCCFRAVDSFRASYIRQLHKSGFDNSTVPDSFCYTEPDSWLFDYERKKGLLRQVFKDHVSCLEYQPEGMVERFMRALGLQLPGLQELYLNQTKPPGKA